ncbi:MAG: phosphatidate cytidylyltransferase [Rhodobacterales bacterium]|nr:phosphatidate cytidylyltransferase [Rhodobacterales bacterium]MDX5411882.1 phosphatidate cytidylyltransferase [Rhodobacterales bacterium]
MTTSSKWEDLKARSLSSLLMVAVGAIEIWLGGPWFLALITVVCGLMIWELVRMLMPQPVLLARGLAVLASLSMLAAVLLSQPLLLLAPLVLGAVLLRQNRLILVLYGPVVMYAAYGLVVLRDAPDGLIWLIWLVLVVVVTDVAGYFAGRMIGGPKFWPAISPKKTWSGTIAGWLGAGGLAFVFIPLTSAGPALVLFSMLVSFASQMGDIAESAIKRRSGVKDSSSLIPGHGGVLDRFDGLIGAALVVLLLMAASGQLPDQP